MDKGDIDAKEVLHDLYSYRKLCIEYKQYLITEHQKVNVEIRLLERAIKDLNGGESCRH